MIAKSRQYPEKVKDKSGSILTWSKSFVLIVRSKTHSEGKTTLSGPLLGKADKVHYVITDADVKTK